MTQDCNLSEDIREGICEVGLKALEFSLRLQIRFARGLDRDSLLKETILTQNDHSKKVYLEEWNRRLEGGTRETGEGFWCQM
jgi:hypothetical protein